MKTLRIPTQQVLALAGAGLLASCSPTRAAEFRFEAEAKLPAGDAQVLEDAAASGGRAISIAREWEPLLRAEVPAGAPDKEWHVWIRHKNGPLLLKSVAADGAQKDLQWIWAAPKEWTWSRAGRIARALAPQVLVIRGGKQEAPDAILDCLAFSDSDQPPAAAAVAVAAPNVIAASANANTNNGAPPESAALALGAADAPAGITFEAEAKLRVGGGQVLDVPGASGGKAVTSGTNWEPLAFAPLPAAKEGEPNGFKVWVRHKNGPILIKSLDGDKQADLKWVWDKPRDWKWSETGPFTRAQIGEGILVIRGGQQETPAPIVDTIVLAPEAVRELPPFEQRTAAPALRVAASVDWAKPSHTLRAALWGMNDYEILNPANARDEKFQSFLKQVDAPLIRIHNGGLSESWMDAKTKTWDRDKIVAGFKASTGYGNARVMLNIARPPSWLTTEGVLTPEQEDAWAAQMADLARLLKSEKIRVDYWELTNEMDTAYEKAGRLPDLWRLVNKCVLAVKKVDPKAKVGGPALTWPKPEWVEGLFRNCGQNLDFVTWHNYASGDIYDSNEAVLGKAGVIAGMAQSVVDAAKKFAPGRKFEMFLTEHNIKWVWEPIERRHGNNIGALFQASTIRRLAPTGIDGATVWHAKGNAYGLIGGDNTVRSTGHLFTWSRYLHGQVLASTSEDETALELLPIAQADGSRSLLLLAKADRAVEVDASKLLGGRKWTAQRIDASGLREKVEIPTAGQWSLPGYSLTLLRSAAN